MCRFHCRSVSSREFLPVSSNFDSAFWLWLQWMPSFVARRHKYKRCSGRLGIPIFSEWLQKIKKGGNQRIICRHARTRPSCPTGTTINCSATRIAKLLLKNSLDPWDFMRLMLKIRAPTEIEHVEPIGYSTTHLCERNPLQSLQGHSTSDFERIMMAQFRCSFDPIVFLFFSLSQQLKAISAISVKISFRRTVAQMLGGKSERRKCEKMNAVVKYNV